MGIFDSLMGTSPLGAALGFVGQLSTNEQNKDLFAEANQFSAAQSQTNRDFQERMSSTAYQRAVKDMIDAGLNPMLAYSQGGASSPNGSSASSIAAPRMENPGAAGAQSAMQIATVQNTQADTDKKIAETNFIKTQDKGYEGEQNVRVDRMRKDAELIVQNTNLSQEQRKKVTEEINQVTAATANLSAQEALTKVNTVLARYDLPRMKAEAAYFETEIGRLSPHNKYGPQTGFRFLESSAEKAGRFFNEPKSTPSMYRRNK